MKEQLETGNEAATPKTIRSPFALLSGTTVELFEQRPRWGPGSGLMLEDVELSFRSASAGGHVLTIHATQAHFNWTWDTVWMDEPWTNEATRPAPDVVTRQGVKYLWDWLTGRRRPYLKSGVYRLARTSQYSAMMNTYKIVL